MEFLEQLFVDFANYAWGTPLLVLLVGGGIFFLVFSRFMPYRNFKHGIEVLSGKYEDPDAPGDINHFQALSSTLAATVGMGNISGVAIALGIGGPGAIFWMWVTAIVGMATKFFTCTLSIMYRGEDSSGKIQGGPMYYITEGLGQKWKPLAIFFSVAGLIGCTPMFQSNQLTQIIRDTMLAENGLLGYETMILAGSVLTETGFRLSDMIVGLILVALVSLVIFGGIKRIGHVAARLVPLMVLLYIFTVVYIIINNIVDVPHYFWLIVSDAFTGEAAAGGALWVVISNGIRRGAFSNEAGIGTEAMAHGAAKTREPVREGLVGMLEPAIDTLLVCTMTAFALLMTGAWTDNTVDGITMTAVAFDTGIPVFGTYLLLICVFIFSITTMFTYSYYGTKCLNFIGGAHRKHYYNYFYIFSIFIGSITTIDMVVNLVDGMFAMMAIPTMIGTLLLAPKVVEASKDYFMRKKRGDFDHY
ncbi:alanine/glycine:cation symporter family protein [Rhodohalobacter sp.]|uniref:alanine/glycine:cation symporter family protein n=1 Tax=Rhodohalobacter sp. TaxID=1974210 RepID=UPI002ACDDB9F|nr:alanine/glycine:cation symporter family protein [Rhodohalobacter sp.]MDZ7758445.1 alanine/glycine:cation symporter family protein [Rhodohalobacter sp.]